nr:AAA family ATPase [Armatimonas rosea]
MTTEPVVRAQHLRSALALYKGEFAPGFYLDILLTERERLNALAQSARERLAELEATQSTEVTLPAPVLPVPVRTENRFFGRQSELEHLQLLLEDFRLVTLLGPGGTGKTRLAQELQATTPSSHFISLSSLRNGTSIPDAIVSTLALPDSTDTALVRLRAAFAEKSALLILDNVEQLVTSGGAEAIASVLEAVPTLRLLATSRIRLDLPQESACQLSPLPKDDAVALFVDRARLAKSSFVLTDENEEAIAELCRRLDGLPLAIELAAARAAILTPQQILERLARRFDLLSDKRRDREERHTSLRAALDWGWSLLAPDVQRFFTQLCIFRGSFSLEAAEAITGEFLAIDYLQSLADGSFLVAEGERFRLLETLREYGLEKLSKDDSDTLTQKHADYFIDWTAERKLLLNGAQFAEILALFKQEQDNFIAALDRTLISDAKRAVVLCLNVARFWNFSYWLHPALSYLQQALAATERAEIPAEQVALLHSNLGLAYESLQMDYLSARTHYQKYYDFKQGQLKEREAAGDDDATLFPIRRALAGTVHNLGTSYWFAKDLDAAQRHYNEARILNTAIGNDAWRAFNLCGLYLVAWTRGYSAEDPEEQAIYFEQALRYVQEGEAICREVQQDFYLCYMLCGLARLYPLLNQQERGLPALKEGFEIACALEHRVYVVDFLYFYYCQALHDKRFEEATQFWGAAAGYAKQWDIVVPHEDRHLRPQVNLTELLGQERYDLLYEAGFHASLESLQTLAARIHTSHETQRLAY